MTESADRRNDSKTSVLLVDDQQANLLALESVLQDLGLNLVQTNSGEEALLRVVEDEFAAVLLDVQMRGLDGFQTARLIRGQERSRHTPIIFLTAYDANRATIQKAYVLGAVDFLIKPIMPVVLQAKVSGFVELFEKTRQIKRQAEQLREMERRAFEAKLAEGDARQREQRAWFRVTLSSIGDAVITTDTGGRVTFLNPVAESLTGWTREEADGLPLEKVFRIVNEQTRETVENPAVRALTEGVIVGLANHTILIARDGVERPIDDSAAPIRAERGEVVGSVLTFRDITERRRTEDALRQSESRKTAILNTSLDAVITIDQWSKVVEFNPSAERIFGYSRDKILGQDMAGLIVPSFLRERHRRGMTRLIATGEGSILNQRIEMPALRSDGVEFPIELAITRIAGDPPLFTAFVRDITNRKRSERSLGERARLAEFGFEVGIALTHDATLSDMLRHCTEATVRHIDAAFARVWTVSEAGDMLELQASSGLYTHLDGPHSRVPVGQLKIGLIAKERKPHLTNTVVGDPAVADQEWAEREGMVAFAGYPLVVEDRLIGVIALFSRRPLTEADLQALASVADWIAVGIDRKRIERERERLLEEAQAARARAEDGEARLAEADRQKDNFLALLGHELRNPLAPIRNAVVILGHAGHNVGVLEQARDMIDRQVTHLTRLVDELLDASRIVNGKIHLRRERLDLGRLIRAAVEDHRAGLDSSRLTLEMDVPPDPIWVEGDVVRLTQIASNLLHNATKFTDAGGRVTVRVKTDETKRRTEVAVHDTGMGMEPSMLDRLFEPFSQADRSLERSRGGLGLGLALVKGLVELHGGEVRASSEGAGRGSVFTFWLPPAQAPNTSSQPLEPPPPRVGSRKLLIIEDNKDAADSLRMLLTLLGHEVTIAYSGQDGVKAARRVRPEIVLCDLGLPGLSGFEVAQALRADPAVQGVKLIAVSGYGQEEDRRKARDAGFDRTLVKPVAIDDLQQLLAELGD